MGDQQGDDLSDMLSELAKAQQGQEAELSELAGLAPARPAVGAPAPVDDKEETIVEAMVEDSGEISATAVAEASEDDAAQRPMVNAAVEELYAVQHENDDPQEDDMLAALAQQAGGEVGAAMEEAPAVAAFEQEAAPRSSSRAAASTRSSGRHHHKPAKPEASAQAIFAPILVTFGLLTLLPAIWAVLILMGVKTWMHDGQDVNGMAKLMLVCWPVSLGLLTGGIYSIVQVSKEKAKQKKRDEALAAKRR